MAADSVHSDEQHREHTLLATLEAAVVPSLFAGKRVSDTLRVWIPGCAGGEMTYGVASVLYAYAEQLADPPNLQIFASDSDVNAIATARRGCYGKTLPLMVPPRYVQRFFHYDQQHYQITATVRQLITFAQHKLLHDPPFSRLDLIVCAHLLSGLTPGIQEQLAHEFHWCLRTDGYLMLGRGEYGLYLEQLFVHHRSTPGLFQKRGIVVITPRLAPQYVPDLHRQPIDRSLEMVNEQLLAMNKVLRRKVAELAAANNDLNNLMSAADLAIIFLDNRLQITRFTTQAAHLFNLIATDRGRPLTHIRHTLDYHQLSDDAASVLASLQVIEREVRRADGNWYLVRLRPYRTEDQRIAGVVLTGVDITARRLAEAEVRHARDELELRVLERTEALRTANIQLQVEIAERNRLEHERTELLRKLVMTQEEERRCIARELHDQLGQLVSALGIGLEILENPHIDAVQHQQTVMRLQQIAIQMDRDMERLARELRPLALDDMGLIEAIQQHVEQWAEDTGISTDFQLVDREVVQLPQVVESVIYRVIQEALTNVLKHAAAHSVSVVLERHRTGVRVVVEDDGCGFDLDVLQQMPSRQRRLGLVGMRERVALAGGTLTFQTAPGAGTTLFVQIPIPSHAPDESVDTSTAGLAAGSPAAL